MYNVSIFIMIGISFWLAILLVLMVWTMVSHSLPSASSGSVEPEPASSEVLEPQNLVPSFIGMDYAQVQNNREYTGMYLFYVTEEYSDTVPAGQIMTQEPAADTVLKAGETIRLVVSMRRLLCSPCYNYVIAPVVSTVKR